MVIDLPQAIYLVLVILSIGINMQRFGQEKDGAFGWIDVFWGPAIGFGLLYWGGFFTACN